MQSYVLAIAGAVLISALVTIIAPSGKMGKFVKGAMKLFLIVVLVTPFVRLSGGGEWEFSPSEELSADPTYMAQCAEMMSEADAREIEALVRETFGAEVRASVARDAEGDFPRKKITVEFSDPGIFGQGEHKDITDRVQAFLSDRYGCPVEVA